jgi:hypothetical protein
MSNRLSRESRRLRTIDCEDWWKVDIEFEKLEEIRNTWKIEAF